MFTWPEKPKTFYLTILLISIGIFLRLALYWHNRSFWLDEVALALNINQRTWTELFLPLDSAAPFIQGAPLGFLLVQKLIITILGISEKIFRLFPLICGISAIFLFNTLARKIINEHATLVALGLFSINKYLIHYSVENKQYSSDVIITIVLLLCLFKLRRDSFSVRNALWFGLISAVLLWFSHPATFVVSGITLTLIIIDLSNKNYQELKGVFLISLLIGVSFSLLYLVSLRQLGSHPYLLKFWLSKFLPFPPKSLADARWLFMWIFNLVRNPGGLSLTGYGVFLLLGGCLFFYRTKREVFGFLITPFIITLLASALHKYPFYGRLVLFSAPLLLLFIGQGADLFYQILKEKYKFLGICLLLLLFLNPSLSSLLILLKPPPKGMKTTLEFIVRNKNNEDIIFVHKTAKFEFLFYKDMFGIKEKEYQIVDDNTVRDTMDRFDRLNRLWILIIKDDEKGDPAFLRYFDTLAKRIISYYPTGSTNMLVVEWALSTATYLYDLRGWQPNPQDQRGESQSPPNGARNLKPRSQAPP